MNRSLLYGFLVGLTLAALAGLLLYRVRPAPAGEGAAGAQPGPGAPGRYQLVSSIEILMLDTASGELWFYRHGRWHKGAGAPRDDGDRGAALGEVDGRERGAAPPEREPEPVPSLPLAAPEERGRAEVIQVESAPEAPVKKRARAR